MFQDFDQFRRPDWFRITLDGIQAGDFREVKGLEIQVPIEEYAEGGLNDHAHKLPGQARFSTILLRRGSSDSLELFDWIESAMRGDLEFRSGSIMALNARSEPVLIWEFRKAWPCRYEGSGFDRARPELHIETLELGHHGFTLRRGAGGSLVGPRPSSAAQAPSPGTEPARPSAAEAAQARQREIRAEYKETYRGVPKAEIPKHAYPQMTSAVVDKQSGEVFLGTSGPPLPENVHPALAEAQPKTSLTDNWDEVNNCAECSALNDALWAREQQTGQPAQLEDFEVHTVYNSSDPKKPAKPARACPNCTQTLSGKPGVDVTSGLGAGA